MQIQVPELRFQGSERVRHTRKRSERGGDGDGERRRGKNSTQMKGTKHKKEWARVAGPVAGVFILLAEVLLAASLCSAASGLRFPGIFQPESTPADSIYGLSVLVLAITGLIFVIVFGLIAYAV